MRLRQLLLAHVAAAGGHPLRRPAPPPALDGAVPSPGEAEPAVLSGDAVDLPTSAHTDTVRREAAGRAGKPAEDTALHTSRRLVVVSKWLAVGGGRWAVGGGRWAMGGGRWAVSADLQAVVAPLSLSLSHLQAVVACVVAPQALAHAHVPAVEDAVVPSREELDQPATDRGGSECCAHDSAWGRVLSVGACQPYTHRMCGRASHAGMIAWGQARVSAAGQGQWTLQPCFNPRVGACVLGRRRVFGSGCGGVGGCVGVGVWVCESVWESACVCVGESEGENAVAASSSGTTTPGVRLRQTGQGGGARGARAARSTAATRCKQPAANGTKLRAQRRLPPHPLRWLEIVPELDVALAEGDEVHRLVSVAGRRAASGRAPQHVAHLADAVARRGLPRVRRAGSTVPPLSARVSGPVFSPPPAATLGASSTPRQCACCPCRGPPAWSRRWRRRRS
jgi:hypothetical protein